MHVIWWMAAPRAFKKGLRSVFCSRQICCDGNAGGNISLSTIRIRYIYIYCRKEMKDSLDTPVTILHIYIRSRLFSFDFFFCSSSKRDRSCVPCLSFLLLSSQKGPLIVECTGFSPYTYCINVFWLMPTFPVTRMTDVYVEKLHAAKGKWRRVMFKEEM